MKESCHHCEMPAMLLAVACAAADNGGPPVPRDLVREAERERDRMSGQRRERSTAREQARRLRQLQRAAPKAL